MDSIIEMPLKKEECIICFEETEDFMFFPCQHKVCPVCFPKLHQCPLCQTISKNRTVRSERRDIPPDYCQICCSIVIIMMFCIWCLHLVNLL